MFAGFTKPKNIEKKRLRKYKNNVTKLNNNS